MSVGLPTTARTQPVTGISPDAKPRVLHVIAPGLLVLALTALAIPICEPRVRIEWVLPLIIAFTWLVSRLFGWDRAVSVGTCSAWLLSLTPPDLNQSWIAFFGLVPFLLVCRQARSRRRALWYGFVIGTALVFTVFSWGLEAFAKYANCSRLLAVLMFVPFAMLLAAKIPLFALATNVGYNRVRLSPLLFLPACYALLEVIGLQCYPWHLGLSQCGTSRICQGLDIFGMPGLAFLIVLSNVAFVAFGDAVKDGRRPAAARMLALAVLPVLAVICYGEVRLQQLRAAEGPARQFAVGVVQPRSPIKVLSTDTATKQQIVSTLDSLASATATLQRPEFIVFAESAAPMGYQAGYNIEFGRAYRHIASDMGVPILTDNIHFARRDEQTIFWRGALVINPDGEVGGEYFKTQLVPFGEYLPLESICPAVKRLFPFVKSYERGDQLPEITVAGVRIAPQICFEITHPYFTRSYAARGANLIVNSANDAWFGPPKQAEQHLAMARMRAIENRLPVVRAANTGPSAFISAAGEMLAPPSPLNSTYAATVKVPLVRGTSLFRLTGPLFGWLCGLFVVCCLGRDVALPWWRTRMAANPATTPRRKRR